MSTTVKTKGRVPRISKIVQSYTTRSSRTGGTIGSRLTKEDVTEAIATLNNLPAMKVNEAETVTA